MVMKRTVEEMIEDLARKVQQGFDGTPTKEAFRVLDGKVDTLSEDIGILRKDMDAGFGDMKQTLQDIRDDLRDFKVNDAQFYDLRARVERLEKKAGIAK